MNMVLEAALADLLLTVAQLSTPKFPLSFKLDHDEVYINTPAVTYELSLNPAWNNNSVDSIHRIKTDLVEHVNKHTQKEA